MTRSSKESLWTIREILNWTKKKFTQMQFNTPRLDAEILLSKALNKDRIYLYINMDKPLTAQERELMRQFVKRRLKYEPIAYIIGKKEFYSINFNIDNGVLIPRPETESLIEASRKLLSDRLNENINILDLCSGSGVLGITLKSIFPESTVYLIEKNTTAIKNTLKNISDLSLKDIIVLKADIKQLPFKHSGIFSLIISNPPYINKKDMKFLSPEIKLYEDPESLYGGDDGCHYIPYIYDIVKNQLSSNGFCIIEFPYKQFKNAFSILKNWTNLKFYDNILDYGNNIQGFIINLRE